MSDGGASYVLPLRWRRAGDVAGLSCYLAGIADLVEIIVVDASPPEIYDANRVALAGVASHVAPDADLGFPMGKVNGVLTGLRLASHDRVVLADDDVRYRRDVLVRVVSMLDDVEVVRPQNYFDPMPWHAHWDTARTLLHRAFGHDWPGTLGVRRSLLLAAGGYDGNAMFENLELVRTVIAAGGTEAAARGIYVRRLPPTTEQFCSQRVRQAYDELARPALFGLWLAIAPLAMFLAVRRRRRALMVLAATPIAVAELGRRRDGGAARFPPTASVLAPAWVAERAICSWLAIIEHVRFGGVRYGDTIVPRAATPARALRRRLRRGAPA